jgi:hypothetical protein
MAWQSTVGLTFLTEDAVEWVLAWLGWWGHGELHTHQLCPGFICVDAELLDTVLNTEVHIIDGVVQRWNDHEDGKDCEC